MTMLLLALGLVLLTWGAELLVSGAARLALRLGISSLVVGLTVVAFGTSAPELGVSVQASLNEQGPIALGNIVGSNIFNVLFILGISAIIVPLTVAAQLIRFDVPVMIAVSLLAWWMASDGSYSRVEGIVLLVGIVAYTAWLIRLGRAAGAAAAQDDVPQSTEPVLLSLVKIAIGLAMLVLGSRWLVQGAVAIAQWMNISEEVVGLTIVAAGTSLPEVVTSIVAALRGQRDIAVGNVVGSNVFNLLSVLGAATVVSPAPIVVPESMIWFDLPVMCAVAFVTLPMFFTGGVLARWEGGVLLAYYVAYTAYLVMDATDHPWYESFGRAMVLFALPLTALTIAVTCWNHWRGVRTGVA